MALEAVVFQQDLLISNNTNKEISNNNLLGLSSNNWSYFDDDLQNYFEEDHNHHDNWFINNYSSLSSPTFIVPHGHDNNYNDHDHDHGVSQILSNYNMENGGDCNVAAVNTNSTSTSGRVKRRRSRTRKNREEIENQRMTHIAVERNRRKQMNEYLSVLRSLMPDSYVQRGDQASIIGGAINYVKELEHVLQLLGSHKQPKIKENPETSDHSSFTSSLPFSEFFTFPQYSSLNLALDHSSSVAVRETMDHDHHGNDHGQQCHDGQPCIADIEVTMVETHANLKIRSKKRPKQLLKIVSGLHSLRLTILHLNVTTSHQIVLYSLSLKVEDDCKLNSVDEIAKAVYEMLCTIHEDYGN